MLIDVTDASFEEEVLKSSIPVLVDFWAEWCGPCQMIAPVLKEIAPVLEGKVKIVKINIDHNPKTPAAYGVRGIPTLLIFKDGKIHDTRVGLLPKTSLLEWLRSV